MSKKKVKNIVRWMMAAVMVMLTAIATEVFPSYAVDADSISSEGNIVLEDGEAAFYAGDIEYLANELKSMDEELSDEDKNLSVPVEYVRKNKVKSKGIIDYAGTTVVMNAADLIYIANEMDVFENTYKYMILKYLNDIQTYMTADGSVTHNEADSDVSYIPTFGQLIKGISLSQEVNTGTTADNLSEGMGAWINGKYITGNGNDVNAAYEKGETEGYQKGEADGYQKGEADGYQKGETEGYQKGEAEGYQKGETEGYQKGKTEGYQKGETEGYQKGETEGYQKGETAGYQKGVADVVANPLGYGISASTLIDTVELYSVRQDFNDWTGYLTVPHDGVCTFIIKAGISMNESSVANDFTCSVYRGDTRIAYCNARDVYGDALEETGLKKYTNYLELPDCTAGETLRIYIEKKYSDSTWIMGIA